VVITLSLVVFFGFVLALLLRTKALGFGGALVAMLFGFFLASTDASRPIARVTAAAITALSDLTR
jgi:hypothetical protein